MAARTFVGSIHRFALAALALSFATAWPTLNAAEPPAETISSEELAQVKAAENARIEAIGKVYGAVVSVYGNDRQGGGSGVLINAAGLALTNHHVVAGAGVEGWGGLADGKLYRWKLVGTDPGGDVALIQLRGRGEFPNAPLGDSRQVRVGDWAMAMGNPFTLAEDQRPTVTLGIVSGVDRYQGGAGENTLVYGRCLQVDSSINPGNSGGPLFNIRGGLIGINGRASFEERGRVNVGAGYAIALEQIVKFVPDLYATKLAQHGTLDAVFGNRERGVVCHTLNLDSRAAKDGLVLGDKLLEFEGEAIHDVNQFTNLVSTLPAEWPAQLVVEREGTRHTIRTRLVALPYAAEEEEKKPEEKEGTPPKEGEKPAPKPKPEKKPMRPGQPKVSFGKAGAIRDVAMNREHAEKLLAGARKENAWQAWPADVKGIELVDELKRGDQVVGQQTIVIGVGGNFRIDYTLDGATRSYGRSGERIWTTPTTEKSAAERLFTDPLAAQAAVLAALATEKPLANLGAITLDGGDKAANQPAYRIKVASPQNRELFVWLRVLDEAGQMSPRLLKMGGSVDGESPLTHVRFGDWLKEGTLMLPGKRTLVADLAEETLLDIMPVRTAKLPEVASDRFDQPAAGEEQK